VGIVKLNVAADEVPELVTEAEPPAGLVVVVPTAIVAALPGDPGPPEGPVGIVKLNVAADEVPELVTDAEPPAGLVVVVPTAIVAALPGDPGDPGDPGPPEGPVGIVKLNVAADELPELVTDAEPPAGLVVVVPTAIVAALPVEPVNP
jgi:hypothetical protein